MPLRLNRRAQVIEKFSKTDTPHRTCHGTCSRRLRQPGPAPNRLALAPVALFSAARRVQRQAHKMPRKMLHKIPARLSGPTNDVGSRSVYRLENRCQHAARRRLARLPFDLRIISIRSSAGPRDALRNTRGGHSRNAFDSASRVQTSTWAGVAARGTSDSARQGFESVHRFETPHGGFKSR